MAQGIKALRKIALGAEASTSAGTAVPATTIWRGMGAIQNTTEVVTVEEDIGILMPTDRTYVSKLGAELAFDETPLTFEQVGYLFQAGIALATPTTDTGSAYIWTHNFPTSDTVTAQTYTIEGGDNAGVEEMEYSFVKDFSLTGNAGEAWNMSGTWEGRQVSTSAFTSTAAIPTVETALFGKSYLYINESTGAWGGTLVSQTLLSAELSYTTGLMAVFTANGQLYFDFIKGVRPEGTLTVTFEHNATAVAEKAAWLAQTERRIQLKITGAALTVGGAYTVKTLLINLIGKWETFDALGDQDGNDIVTGTFKFGFSVAQDTAGQIILVNELSALP